MYSKIKQFLDAVPRALTSANEIYNFARNKYKQIMGVFPDGLDDVFLRRGAAEMQDTRKKVIKFPEDKITDPFKPRPDPRVKQPPGAKMDVIRANENIAGGSGYAKGDTKYNADVLADEIALMRGANREDLSVDDQIKLYGEAYDYLAQFNRLNNPSVKGEFGITVLDDAGKPLETKATTPEGIMNFLMGKGKSKDVNIGKAPKTTKKKPAVDPELQKAEDNKQMFMDFENRIETEAEMLERMNRQNKEAVERIKKRKEKDVDPEDKAEGGRIGFSGGGAGFAGNQVEQAQPGGQTDMPRNLGFQPLVSMPQFNIPASGGVSELKQFLQATGAPELGMGYNFPVGKSGVLGLKAAPSGNVGMQFKMPLSGGMFGLGKKDGGRIGFKDGTPKDPGRRGFLKLLAGLASIPVVGKLFKPAAKVADAAPVVQEGVKLGYENFMLLVDKIKRLGKPADDLATQERQRVTTYSGKNGNEYELVEDLTTGDMSITKDKTGFIGDADQTIDVIEDRSTFIYKKGEDIVDTKTGKSQRTPDEYDEVKQTSSGPEDAFDDVTEIDDRSVNEVLDELKGSVEMDDLTLSQMLGPGSPRSKKAGGGLAYMLGE